MPAGTPPLHVQAEAQRTVDRISAGLPVYPALSAKPATPAHPAVVPAKPVTVPARTVAYPGYYGRMVANNIPVRRIPDPPKTKQAMPVSVKGEPLKAMGADISQIGVNVPHTMFHGENKLVIVNSN